MLDSLFLILAVPTAAVALDAWLGDPKSWPHPVRLIGWCLDTFESSVRKLRLPLKVAGWLALLCLPTLAWTAAAYFISIPVLGGIAAVYLAFAGLALGCLIKDAQHAARLIDSGDLSSAREAVSYLVSRETSAMEAAELRKTLAETVSENLNDGFVAPLFYLCLLGPGGLWAYKTVSTMDSMWGYRTERFRDLGYAAARADDVLAFFPARITAQLLLLAGDRMGLDVQTARQRYSADAVMMESPNAGWPMAAVAWLVQGRMGGDAVYHGEMRRKPILGPEDEPWDVERLRLLLRLCCKAGRYAAWMFIPALGLVQAIVW